MAENKQKMFRMIPAMDRLLTSSYLEDKVTGYPRNLVQRAINIVLKGLRHGIDNETIQDLSALDIISVSEMVLAELKILSKPSLRPKSRRLYSFSRSGFSCDAYMSCLLAIGLMG